MFALLIAVIYLSFISLGLPDSLLGAAWPTMQQEFGVPVSYAGIVSVIISLGTIISSVLSDRITKKFGSGLVTAVSVLLTALALLGFSLSKKFWTLIIFAVPYGLGAGGVDACLNNYVALHLKSRHMSWLHCMWGVGASISPYIMGFALSRGNGWNNGYLIVSIIQIVISVIIFISLPLWKRRSEGKTGNNEKGAKPLKLKEVISIPGAVPCFITFFCYCALEQTVMLWASSYMVAHNSLSAERAASFASLFFIGITVGRGLNGFLTIKLSDKALIRGGLCIIAVGIVCMAIPAPFAVTAVGVTLTGLGCAPVYPSIIHMTPSLFGADKSQAVIGLQMASAYLGSLAMPPVYGLIANGVSAQALPVFISVFFIALAVMHEVTQYKAKNRLEVTG